MHNKKIISYVESITKTETPFIIVLLLGGIIATFLGMLSKHVVFSSYILLLCICGIVCTLFVWLSEIGIRTRYYYTQKIWQSMLISVVLFIFSEILIFTGIFWVYFDRTYNKWNIQMSMPNIYEYIDVTETPLIGTILLIFSGICMNITIYKYIYCYRQEIYFFIAGWLFGFFFFLLQIVEYFELVLSINVDVYSSLFYLITGLHGVHVVIGLLLLLYCGPLDITTYLSMLFKNKNSRRSTFIMLKNKNHARIL